jgi:hypothetical protein
MERLKELWDAANTHCVSICGEWLDEEWDGEDVPPLPDDPDEALDIIITYLKESV